MIAAVLDLAFLCLMPVLLNGVINRTRSLWSGRKGPPLFQLAFDLRRLLAKSPVYSQTTTIVFRVAPYVFFFTALASAAIVPFDASTPLVSFPLDFVWLAYAWGLGRVALMLAALDTGSSFEGMGATREATYAALLEPAFFLAVGALSWVSHQTSLAGSLTAATGNLAGDLVHAAAAAALFVVLQVETGRLPVDDPSTHLELTMIHEVMVLDTSGPELAAIQLANAIKLSVGAALIATLLNPLAGAKTMAAAAANALLCFAVAIVLGTVESLIARFKLAKVPLYIGGAVAMGVAAVALSACSVGGLRP